MGEGQLRPLSSSSVVPSSARLRPRPPPSESATGLNNRLTFKMCCPNFSVLNKGLFPPWLVSLDAAGLDGPAAADWAFPNRCVVARGILRGVSRGSGREEGESEGEGPREGRPKVVLALRGRQGGEAGGGGRELTPEIMTACASRPWPLSGRQTDR